MIKNFYQSKVVNKIDDLIYIYILAEHRYLPRYGSQHITKLGVNQLNLRLSSTQQCIKISECHLKSCCSFTDLWHEKCNKGKLAAIYRRLQVLQSNYYVLYPEPVK